MNFSLCFFQIRKFFMHFIRTTFALIRLQATSKTSKSNRDFLSIKLQFCFDFNSFSKKTVQLIESKKDLACELVASWSVQVGDLDQCIHLWRYTGGFEKVDLAERELKKDAVSLENFRREFESFDMICVSRIT